MTPIRGANGEIRNQLGEADSPRRKCNFVEIVVTFLVHPDLGRMKFNRKDGDETRATSMDGWFTSETAEVNALRGGYTALCVYVYMC